MRVFIFRPVWPFSKNGIYMLIYIETHRDIIREAQEWEGQEGWRLSSCLEVHIWCHFPPVARWAFESRSYIASSRACRVCHRYFKDLVWRFESRDTLGSMGEVSFLTRAQQSISHRTQQLLLRSICLFMQEVNLQKNFQNIEQAIISIRNYHISPQTCVSNGF